MTLPPKIAAAMVAVMGDIRMLGKGNENQHARYKFAGIDDFLEATRPLCAKHGLIIIQDELETSMNETTSTDNYGKTKTRTWLTVKYSFTIAHASGEIWDRSPVRTIAVEASMGSQAYGAAQSYALKQFMRTLFQMATGDGEDADNNQPETLPSASEKLLTPAQVMELLTLAKDVGADVTKFEKHLKVTKLTELPYARFEYAKSALEAKRVRASETVSDETVAADETVQGVSE